uniref:Uncharacterized protein n=1 Tax=Arundo donax TaxID=35708 RepID=A0A0A8YTA6_ARUDO
MKPTGLVCDTEKGLA